MKCSTGIIEHLSLPLINMIQHIHQLIEHFALGLKFLNQDSDFYEDHFIVSNDNDNSFDSINIDLPTNVIDVDNMDPVPLLLLCTNNNDMNINSSTTSEDYSNDDASYHTAHDDDNWDLEP